MSRSLNIGKDVLLVRGQLLNPPRKCNASAFKEADAGCSAAEASKYAKATEERARKDGLTLEEYHDLCARAVQLLQSSVPPGQIDDQHVDEHIFPNLPTTEARIGRYVNSQHFKDGLFSEVFKAVLPGSEGAVGVASLVALKITTPSMMVAPHDAHREARILAAAKGDNVIPLLETFPQAGGHFVMAFPFMPHDLNILLREGQLTEQSRRTILKDMFSGLAHLHNLNIIHRDIKPSNILLSSPNGPAYLADLGIAWSSTDAASEPANAKILDVGTTCYRPPELLFGQAAYGSTLDMWAAGCVAAQVVCLGGKTLFDAGDLGSELALIKSIFETLGTPNLEVWPEASSLPDWGKMNFAQYPAKPWTDILPNAGQDAVDLVQNLVIYESGWRLKAEMALKHPYLQC